MKKTINDLLIHVIKTIKNKEECVAMVKDVILPMMAKEQQSQTKEVTQTKEVVPTIKEEPKQLKEHTNSLVPPVQSGNGHKVEKINPLEEWEKDLIRSEFIKLNGEILRDTCLEIKKKLNKNTAIFQVTGFVSLLHKYVLKGELNLPSLGHYHYFQHLKKYGEQEYKNQFQSGKKTRVISITHS